MTESDNKILIALQNNFLEKQNTNALEDMYILLTSVSNKLLRSILNNYKHYVCISDQEEIIHDVSTEILEKIMLNKLKIETSFSGYIYKIILHKLFGKKRNVIHIDTIEEQQSEDTTMKTIEEEELADLILELINFYTQGEDDNTKIEIMNHVIKILGRGKNYNSYMYNIKKKRDKEIFQDIMCEFKVHLKGRTRYA